MKSILQEEIKKRFKVGAIVNDGTFVCEMGNITLDWESPGLNTNADDKEFIHFATAVFNKEVLFIARNYVEWDDILELEERIEEWAIATGRQKLKIHFPILHVACPVSQLEEIFSPIN